MKLTEDIKMQGINLKNLIGSLIFFVCINALADQNDCIHQAATCFKVNPLLIQAIIWKESYNRQETINFNKNNTHDVGVMQINSIHFNLLNKIGISEDTLIKNSCTNVFSGVWILRNMVNQYGNTWEAIGRYHSKTPSLRNSYSLSIINIIIKKHNSINAINIPYLIGIREKFSC